MSYLWERLVPVEIEDKEGEPAPTELALDYLNQLTREVELGKRGEVVLVANLLQAGQRYPSLSGRFIKHLETSQGPLSVSEETWLEAMNAYIEEIGVPLSFLLEGRDEKVIKDTRTLVFQKKPGLFFKRVREYDPQSNDQTLLRLEIQYRLPGD